VLRLLNLYSCCLPWNLYGDKDTVVLKIPLQLPAAACDQKGQPLFSLTYMYNEKIQKHSFKIGEVT